jgi:thiamine-phosphate pyrophosphorylase
MAAIDAVRHGLYAITPDEADTAQLLAKATAAIKGGAAVLQYRNKTASAARQREQAAALLQLCRAHAVPLIINDDADLALAIGADGVHLGVDDGDLGAARRKLGDTRLIGASCYNRMALAEQASAAGADYLAFGSFFASATKPLAVRAGPHLLAEAKTRFGLPVAAIGGITVANAAELAAAGADWLCVISALFEAEDIETRARQFAACMEQTA